MAYLPVFFIIVAYLPFMFISVSHSSLDYGNIQTSSPAKNNVQKVNLSLYYESLCPYCASFISYGLVKVFQNDLHTIVNLRLVPWGNAMIVDNRTECQHGKEECYLNTIHGCVIHLWPHVKNHFDFIHCTEERSSQRGPVRTQEEVWEEIWEPCSEKLKLSKDRIKECYDSGDGYKLQLQYANETAGLNPPHEYVPWVVVNNQPLLDDFENFVKYVCQAYKGDHVPKACKVQSSDASSANKIQPGCSASESRKLESSVLAPKVSPGSEFSKSASSVAPGESPGSDFGKSASSVAPKASLGSDFSKSASSLGPKVSPRSEFNKSASSLGPKVSPRSDFSKSASSMAPKASPGSELSMSAASVPPKS